MHKVKSMNYVALYDAVFPSYFYFVHQYIQVMWGRERNNRLYSLMHQPSPYKAITLITLCYSVVWNIERNWTTTMTITTTAATTTTTAAAAATVTEF